MDERTKAVLTLVTLAPFFGEVLSISTNFLFFFLPWIFLPLIFLYGFGALIIREYTVRYKKSTLSLMLLATVYAIIEEGLSLRTYFDPSFTSEDNAAARIFGINSVWIVHVTLYHIFFSIWMPIVITHMLFPSVREEPWIRSKRTWRIIIVLYLLINLLFYVTVEYQPSSELYLMTTLVAIVFGIIAIRLPPVSKPAYTIPDYTNPVETGGNKIVLLGFLATLSSFLTAWLFPSQIQYLGITLLALLAIPALAYVLIDPSLGRRGMNYLQLRKLIIGILIFPLLLFPLVAEPISQSIASFITIFLIYLTKKRMLNS